MFIGLFYVCVGTIDTEMKCDSSFGGAMLIRLGTINRQVDLEQVETHQHCQTCASGQPLTLRLEYQCIYLWFFYVLLSQQYYLICTTCVTGRVVDKKSVQHLLTKNPIPLWYRYSWIILVTLIVGVALFYIALLLMG
jgi:hypothetical protein